MDVGGWDVAAISIKAVTYSATLSAAGGAAFWVQHRSTMSVAQGVRVRQWLVGCITVALLASVARIGILSGSMGGDLASLVDRTLARMVLEAGEGRATGLRVAGLLAIAAALALPRRSVQLVFGGAIVAATSFACVGHAWAASAMTVALLSLHLVGVAFWLGALIPLWMATRDDDLARLAGVVHSFGIAAVYVVAALALGGTLVLTALLRTPSELWTTEYGRLVTVKLGVVAVLLGVASFNKLSLTPRVRALDRAAVAALRRSIQVELALGVVVLLVTATLTTLVGPARLE